MQTPRFADQDFPLLASSFGLGEAVAFTSDADGAAAAGRGTGRRAMPLKAGCTANSRSE